MRPGLILFISLTLTLAGCSDDGDPTADAGVDQAISGADAKAEASVGDSGAAEASAGDSSAAGDMTALPSNVTLYANIGDSVAVGYPSTATMAYKGLLVQNDDTTYPSWKSKDLKNKYPNIKLVDQAKFGALSKELAGQATAVGGNPSGDTLVIISIGGNDFAGAIIQLSLDAKAGTTLAKQVTANIDTALKTFADKTKYPGKVAVVLMTFHDPTDGAGKLPNVKGLTGFCQAILLAGPFVGPNVIKGMGLFNAELKAWAARKNVMIADYHARALGHGWNYQDKTNKYYDAKDPSLWFYTDCLHANDRGNHEMRSVIWERMFGK